MKYLVSVERPTGYDEKNIKVTDDTEGFGPGLLAAFPIKIIEADTPQQAAYRYARRFGITNTLVIINLLSNSEEWWMCTDEAHKIDNTVETVWGNPEDWQ